MRRASVSVTNQLDDRQGPANHGYNKGEHETSPKLGRARRLFLWSLALLSMLPPPGSILLDVSTVPIYLNRVFLPLPVTPPIVHSRHKTKNRPENSGRFC